METSATITALTGLITDATATATAAAPLILAVMATLAGIDIGFNMFNRYRRKIK